MTKCFFESPRKSTCNEIFGEKKCEAGEDQKECCFIYKKFIEKKYEFSNQEINPIIKKNMESIFQLYSKQRTEMLIHKCFFETPPRTPCKDLYGDKKCAAGEKEKEACLSYTNTVKRTNSRFKNLPQIPISQLVKESLEMCFQKSH